MNGAGRKLVTWSLAISRLSSWVAMPAVSRSCALRRSGSGRPAAGGEQRAGQHGPERAAEHGVASERQMFRVVGVAVAERAGQTPPSGAPAGLDGTASCVGPAGKTQGMIGFIVAGLIIGALARLLMPGRQKIGLLWTLLLGLAGAVIGGTIANLIGTGDIMELNVIGFIVSVLCSVALLAAAERAGLGQRPDRKRLGHS